MSVDPLAPDYPHYTPYQFAGNDPIANVDLDGLEDYYYLAVDFDKGDPVFAVDKINGQVFRTSSNVYNEPKTVDGKTVYSKGERHIIIYVINYDVFFGFAKGTQVVGKAYNTVEEVFQAKEEDLYWRTRFSAFTTGLEKGQETVDAVRDLKDLAKNIKNLKKGKEILEELGARNKKSSKVETGDVNSYKGNKGVVGDGLSPDHIPSYAATRKAMENKLGRKLSAKEARKLRQETTTVVIPGKIHQKFSRTYGGRNKPLIDMDAKDLRKAATKDMEKLRSSLKGEGFSKSEIKKIFDKVHEQNEKFFKDKGIKY